MPRSTNPRAVMVAVMMATFLAALDTSVVGTAMPTIIGTMGGLALYSWAFSAYLLTSTTFVPMCGRLADMYGRKPVFLAGAALFLAGSALCGSARTMEELILFRALQGLGAAAILPASITVVGDIFALEQRARVQGLLSAVWGVSAILGPGAGGLIVERLNWRWVFYVNLPFGLLSMALFWLSLHERVTPHRRSVDYAGTAALTAAVTLLLLGLLDLGQDGTTLPLSPSLPILASAALLGLFVWHESRAEEPVLPLGLFRSRVVSVSSAAGFLGGATLLGVSSYVPPFVQGVLGGTPTNAGAALMPISIGWTLGSTLSGRLMLRRGYRPVVLLGTALIVAGALPLPTLGTRSSRLLIMAAMLAMGVGMGFSTTAFLVAVQSSVAWGQRGIATASTQFFRSIGGAVGVAGMGALMNQGLSRGLLSTDGIQFGELNLAAGVSATSAVLDPSARAALPVEVLEALRWALASSLHGVFVAVAIAAVAGLALTSLFPAGSVEDHAHREPAPPGGAGSSRPPGSQQGTES